MELTPPPLSRIQWAKAYRIIPSRFPPINVFEEFENSERLAELESITNPRLRETWGDISVVPPERRVTGPGATFVMAPFTHRNKRGSRFSDGTYGVYYAANSFEAAVAETVHHMSLFYAATRDPAHETDFQCLVGKIDAEFHDLRTKPPAGVMDPNDYSAGQDIGRILRETGSNGVVYPSVRQAGSENVGVFWPDVVKIPIQERRLIYRWNGTGIDRIFDQKADAWFDVHDIPSK